MIENLLPRIRAAFGMGLVWGFAWFSAGLAILLVVGLDAADVPFPLLFGFLGFLAGALFSSVLSVVENRRSFTQLSIPRFALWGAVGGLTLAALFVLTVALFGNEQLEFLGLAGVFATAGAICASGSLAIARGATDPAELSGPVTVSQESELRDSGFRKHLDSRNKTVDN